MAGVNKPEGNPAMATKPDVIRNNWRKKAQQNGTTLVTTQRIMD